MPKYRVNWHIKRNRKLIEPGTMIDLKEDEAAPLLADGCITDPNAKPASDTTAPQEKAAPEKQLKK